VRRANRPEGTGTASLDSALGAAGSGAAPSLGGSSSRTTLAHAHDSANNQLEAFE
jgi:hypothetical protein